MSQTGQLIVSAWCKLWGILVFMAASFYSVIEYVYNTAFAEIVALIKNCVTDAVRRFCRFILESTTWLVCTQLPSCGLYLFRHADAFFEEKANEQTDVSDATCKSGLWNTLFTCVFLASPPVAFVMWTINFPWPWCAPVLYGLVGFVNFNKRHWKSKWLVRCIMFALTPVLLYYYYIAWAVVLFFASFYEMQGWGIDIIITQIKYEMLIYCKIYLLIRPFKFGGKVNCVQSDSMICNPIFWVLCATFAQNWKKWNVGKDTKLHMQPTDWVRILTFKRAFVGFFSWRLMLALLLYFMRYMLLFMIAAMGQDTSPTLETVPETPFNASTVNVSNNDTSNTSADEKLIALMIAFAKRNLTKKPI